MNCMSHKSSLGLPNQKSSSLSLNWQPPVGHESMISTASFTMMRWSLVPTRRISYSNKISWLVSTGNSQAILGRWKSRVGRKDLPVMEGKISKSRCCFLKNEAETFKPETCDLKQSFGIWKGHRYVLKIGLKWSGYGFMVKLKENLPWKSNNMQTMAYIQRGMLQKKLWMSGYIISRNRHPMQLRTLQMWYKDKPTFCLLSTSTWGSTS